MNKEIKITLDSFEAVHTVKALLESVERLKMLADKSKDETQKFLHNDHAETLEGVAKQLSSAMWKAGVKADVTVYRFEKTHTDTHRK